jgi:hypothetical protein
LWLADTELAFRRLFEGTKFELLRLEKVGTNTARWDAGSEEKLDALWMSLAGEQTWLSFGFDKLSAEKVEEVKRSWKKEIEACRNDEGFVVKEIRQWVAVAVVKE